MRNIISNTTPILSLLKIGKLNLLKELYSHIIIPQAVYEEIEMGREKPFYKNLLQYEWIEVVKVADSNALSFFVDLDRGEAEVLVLAKEMDADLIIMDELMGRRFVQQLGLKLTGTVGVLLKAKELGLIASVTDLLTELIQKGTWISPKLMIKAKQIVGEI